MLESTSAYVIACDTCDAVHEDAWGNKFFEWSWDAEADAKQVGWEVVDEHDGRGAWCKKCCAKKAEVA